jgi:hypothetical protein
MPELSPPSWEGTAFGLSLRSEFELPGLDRATEGGGSRGERGLELTLGRPLHSAGESWGERLQEWSYPKGPIGLAIDRDAELGYRFYVLDAGVFELSPRGSHAVCRPARDSAWRWRRYLTGQVLPFAALLHGLEVFHASAVEVGGAAIGILGGSGLGKSTLALNLHLGGAGFLADDVMAVERAGPGVVVHPGVATTKVRRLARDLIGPDHRGVLGDLISEDEHELRYGVDPHQTALPLAVVCMLERSPTATEVELIEEKTDPWHLLGSTFNLLVQDRGRLQAQLNLCAEIARQARFVRVRVGERPGPEAAAQLAARLWSLV